MNQQRKQRYLYIKGGAVPVTEEVYQTYWHYEAKEDYFMRQLKRSRRSQDKKTQEFVILPAREVPMEQLSTWHRDRMVSVSDVEDLVLNGVWIEQLLTTLTEEEREIVRQFYILGKTERETCAALGIPRTTFQHREKKLREKLGIMLKKFL